MGFSTDDDSAPKGGYLAEYRECFEEATTRAGLKDVCVDLEGYLLDAGFVDVRVVVKKLPVGPWPKDPKKKVCGSLYLHHGTSGGGRMSEVLRFYTPPRLVNSPLHERDSMISWRHLFYRIMRTVSANPHWPAPFREYSVWCCSLVVVIFVARILLTIIITGARYVGSIRHERRAQRTRPRSDDAISWKINRRSNTALRGCLL